MIVVLLGYTIGINVFFINLLTGSYRVINEYTIITNLIVNDPEMLIDMFVGLLGYTISLGFMLTGSYRVIGWSHEIIFKM